MWKWKSKFRQFGYTLVFLQNRDVFWIFGKKLSTKKWARYHAILHTLICNFILLSFGICVCIWKAVKALPNKGGLGAWGRCNLNSAGRQISTRLPANMDDIPLQKHIQKFEWNSPLQTQINLLEEAPLQKHIPVMGESTKKMKPPYERNNSETMGNIPLNKAYICNYEISPLWKEYP